MFLVIALLNRVDEPEKAILRFRELGLPDPVLLRARSAAAAPSSAPPAPSPRRSTRG